jgi:ABC-type nitrate/sulfonate/bicarbonate transport system substrate-binding protein
LISGNLDAGVGSLEGGMALARKGQGKILLMFGDIVHPFLAHAIFATDDLMTRHPDQLRRFLKTWFATVAYAKAHKAEAIRFSQSVTHLPDHDAGEIYENETPMFSVDGRFDRAAVDVVKQSLVEMSLIDKLPDDKTLFTEEFLP